MFWLDRYAAHRTRKTDKWRHSGRASWHICQTQKGQWDDYGDQSETHPQRQQSCLQPKLEKANPTERTSNRWVGTKMESSQYICFQSTQAPFLRKENPTEKYVFLWISKKSTLQLLMIKLKIFIQSALCQRQHNTWLRNLSPANWIAFRIIAVCRWRTNGQWKCLHSL